MEDRTGQRLGNYRLKHLLGSGGFAEVYLSEHIFLKTFAAIKLLLAQLSSDDLEGFLNEARTIASLNHPNIVRVLDFGVEENTPYLVMDYAMKGTLRQRHSRGTRLPPLLIVTYVKQIAAGLQYAHEQKLIHRDVKPENLLVGKHDEILLSDFGVALVAQSSLYPSIQNVVGTIAYMSPEQIQGKPRSASDQYSLGIVVYEWITGTRPFHGSFAELCTQHMFGEPPSLRQQIPAIPLEVEQVVMTALAKQPNQRYSSIQAFATALEQACELWTASTLSAQVRSDQPPLSSDATQIVALTQYPLSELARIDGVVSSTIPPAILSTLPATIAATSSSPTNTPQFQIQPKFIAKSTDSKTTSAAPHRKRKPIVSVLAVVLAIAVIFASIWALVEHAASNIATTPTATVGLTSTSTPNHVIILPTGSATLSLTKTSDPSPTISPVPSKTSVASPTMTPSPVPVQPVLTTSPGSIYANTDCQLTSLNHTSWACTVTLYNSQKSSRSLNWTASANIPSAVGVIFDPKNGTLKPGQSVQVSVNPFYMSCPDTGTLTFTGSVNSVTIPWRCTALAMFTTNPSSFTNGCLVCTLTLSDPSSSSSSGNWSVGSSNINGVTFSPSGGTLSPGQSVVITISFPSGTTCPNNTSFDFGGTIQSLSVSWGC